MTRRIARRALVGALALGAMTVAAATAPPQTPPSQAPIATGVVVGSIVDGDSGAPIAGAVVRINGVFTPGAARGPAIANNVIATGADGRFLFRNLPKGRYSLFVQKAGYVPGALGQRSPTSGGSQSLDLDEGQRAKDVSISLWKFASLSGTVVDEAGEPLVGTTVKACRRIVLAGVVKLDFQSPEGSALTDDRGIYRHTELLPGDYVVIVASSSITVPAPVQDSYNQSVRDGSTVQTREVGATSAVVPSTSGARIGDYVVSFGRAETGNSGVFRRPGPGELPLAPDGRQMIYRSTFYPNAVRSTEAAVVKLKSGEDRTGIDVQLRPVAGTHISGRLMSPDGPQALFGLRLIAEGQNELNIDSGLMNPVTITNARGEFVFLGVPAGQYTLKAIRRPPWPDRGPGTPPGPLPIPTESTLWASVPLSVGDQGLDGVVVTLSRGLRVSGRVEFEGAGARPAPERVPQVVIDLDTSDARSSFRGIYGVLGQNTPMLGRVETDGQFSTFGVPAQKYILTATNLPPGWTLKSAMFNGRDISYAPLEVIDRDIEGVVVTLTDRPSKLSGVVRTADGQADTIADVLVFPTDKSGWIDGGVSPRRVQLIRAGRNGAYAITGLPPGDYFVAAIPDERSSNVTDAKTLEGLMTSATRVRVTDGAAVVQDLQTLRVK